MFAVWSWGGEWKGKTCLADVAPVGDFGVVGCEEVDGFIFVLGGDVLERFRDGFGVCGGEVW